MVEGAFDKVKRGGQYVFYNEVNASRRSGDEHAPSTSRMRLGNGQLNAIWSALQSVGWAKIFLVESGAGQPKRLRDE